MCYKELPPDYKVMEELDLSENKRTFWIINGTAIVIGVLMVIVGWIICPLNQVVALNWMSLLPVGVAIVGYFFYLILHEAVHGVFMFAFSHTKVKFGFKKIYAYAGSRAYFDKKRYIVIGLAPLVIWGAVLAALNVYFNSGMWFWVIWFIQIGNISGATGDLYVSFKMMRAPDDVLVRDSGVKMVFYRRMTRQELAARAAYQREAEQEEAYAADAQVADAAREEERDDVEFDIEDTYGDINGWEI